MGSVALDAVELEAICKEDSSWHPCQVSLSSDTSTGFGLIVEFESQDSKYIIFTKEEALECLRIRSTPLQGDECLQIKEGEHVLGSQETQFRGLFFDAEVEKVCRVRHSKRIHCRCSFEIRWLHSDLKGGTITVPSSSIMKLARNNIDSHPTIAAFFNSMKTLNCPNVSPFVSFLEDSIYEATLPKILERQIEEISKLAELSREGCSQEILLEFKRVDLMEQARHKTRVEWTKSSKVRSLNDQAPHDQKNSRRTTRSQIKLQQELNEQNRPPSQSILEEPDRPHLSPLGARAALASLMYKLPQKPELSVCLTEKEGFTKEKVSVMDDLFSRVEACPAPDISKHTSITKLPTSGRRDASNKSSRIKGSKGMQNKLEKPSLLPEGPEVKSSITANAKTSLTCSATDRKLNRPMNTTRLTRSAIQKGIGNLNDSVELKSPTEEIKLSSPTPTRLTRSAIQKGARNMTVEGKQEWEVHKSTQDTCSESPKGDFVTPETKETRKKKPSSSPADAEINLSMAQERNKKLRVSDVSRITKRGEISGDGEALLREKSKTKPVLRSSPRLRFLPRTRSQKKSLA